MPEAKRLLELAEQLEDAAVIIIGRADWLWGWRKRDRTISVAFGDVSRALRIIVDEMRSRASQGDQS